METDFIVTDIKRVIMVGKDEYPHKLVSFSHELKHNELIFHFSGQQTVFFNGGVLKINPGTIRFLPKGKPKRYDVHFHERGDCIDVFFDTDIPLSSDAFTVSVSQNEKIGNLFKKLFAVWAGKAEGYYFEAMSLLYRILSEMQKNEYSPKAHYKMISPAADIIHSEFLRLDFSLNKLAEMCNMSTSYFQRLFKKIYGLPPKKYIIQLKINHACELLRLRRYSVTQISEMCNFSDVYFFSRQFKEYIGITPTQFVKKYKSSK